MENRIQYNKISDVPYSEIKIKKCSKGMRFEIRTVINKGTIFNENGDVDHFERCGQGERLLFFLKKKGIKVVQDVDNCKGCQYFK